MPISLSSRPLKDCPARTFRPGRTTPGVSAAQHRSRQARHLTAGLVAVALAGLLGQPPAAADPQPARQLAIVPAAKPTETPPAPAQQNQATRAALVIGNSAYRSGPLRNPANDAKAVADALRGQGFEVLEQRDLGQKAMLEAVRQFAQRLQPGGTALVFYAGHGMQVKGRNYLIPVDADIQSEDEVAYSSFDAGQILDKLEQAKTKVNLLILDACRNNPFARSFRSSTSGLAQMEAPAGTLIAFSTAPGQVAADGEGSNSTYTKALVAEMRKPDTPVEIVFKRVREAVKKDSGDKQIPWESSSLTGDFYFAVTVKPGSGTTQVTVATTTAPAPPNDAAFELAFWDSIKNSRQPGDYRAYLEKYPNGTFATLAKTRLSAAEPVAKAEPAAATMPPAGVTANEWRMQRQQAAPQPGGAAPFATPQAGGGRKPPMAAVGVLSSTDGSSYAGVGKALAAFVVERPDLKAGDRWELVSSASNYEEAGKRQVAQIQSVAAGEVTMRDGWVFDGEWGAKRSVDGNNGQRTVREFSPVFPTFRFPLEVGKRWPIHVERSTAGDTKRQDVGQLRGEARVLLAEEIETPAGKFETLLVEARMELSGRRPDGKEISGFLNERWWYAPKAKRFVRHEQRSQIGGNRRFRLQELAQYEVQP